MGESAGSSQGHTPIQHPQASAEAPSRHLRPIPEAGSTCQPDPVAPGQLGRPIWPGPANQGPKPAPLACPGRSSSRCEPPEPAPAKAPPIHHAGGAARSTVLELRDLTYQAATAPEPLLRGLNLRLEPGRPNLVAGSSGCGKTTLLELVAGLAEPGRGSILWQGQRLTGRQRRWLCGLVFQFPERHFLGLSVGQELKLGQRRLGSDQAAAVLAQVGLEGLSLQQAPERLSGGQQRRLALAVQLLRNPRVLLLDEPTAGLDWSVRAEVLDLLGQLARERVLLVVTHEPDLFSDWVERAWQLERGQLQPLA